MVSKDWEYVEEPETPDEMVERLQAMSYPKQQTWDLSSKDQAAIAWVVEEYLRMKVILEGVEAHPFGRELVARAESET